jgi:hypothetical protein
MVAIITEKFKLHNASQFVESFTEAASSAYYLFIGKPTPFSSTNDGAGASDTSPPTPPDSVSDEFYFWDQMIGKGNWFHRCSSSCIKTRLVKWNFV